MIGDAGGFNVTVNTLGDKDNWAALNVALSTRPFMADSCVYIVKPTFVLAKVLKGLTKLVI